MTTMTMTAVHSDGRNLKFVDEYRRESRYQKLMTLEAYVEMRRVDEGLEPLKAGTAILEEALPEHLEQPTGEQRPNWLTSNLGR